MFHYLLRYKAGMQGGTQNTATNKLDTEDEERIWGEVERSAESVLNCTMEIIFRGCEEGSP